MSSARRLRVAILAGGRSSEHEISLASARSVAAALDPERYEIAEIAIGRDGRWALAAGDAPRELGGGPAETLPVPAEGRTLETLGVVDVVLPILHGPFGEDGTVQGLLELADVPYVGAGVAASALAMDKDLFKKVMRDSGIPVAAHHADPARRPGREPVRLPRVRQARPARLVGRHLEGARGGGARPAVELAFRHDEKVLVEEFVAGTEVEVGVLGNRVPPPIASLPGQIDTLEHEWYDFESKYDDGGMELLVPPPGLSDETIELLQRRAVESFVASECEGLARVDFFVRESDGEVVLNELNTMPGFTATSVWAKLFEASGIGYADALDRLIELALERHERRSKLVF